METEVTAVAEAIAAAGSPEDTSEPAVDTVAPAAEDGDAVVSPEVHTEGMQAIEPEAIVDAELKAGIPEPAAVVTTHHAATKISLMVTVQCSWPPVEVPDIEQGVQTIEGVKQKIFMTCGMPVALQRLFFRGQELPDTRDNEQLGQEFPCKISDFGIVAGSLLHAVSATWVCGALMDGREYFFLPFGASYFFPNEGPVFAVEGVGFQPDQEFQGMPGPGVEGCTLKYQMLGQRMDVHFTCRCDPIRLTVKDIVDTVEGLRGLKRKALQQYRVRQADISGCSSNTIRRDVEVEPSIAPTGSGMGDLRTVSKVVKLGQKSRLQRQEQENGSLRIFYHGALLQETKHNAVLKKEFPMSVRECGIEPGACLHLMEKGWVPGALEDGREFFCQQMGHEYYFPDSDEPVFNTACHETGVPVPPGLLVGRRISLNVTIHCQPEPITVQDLVDTAEAIGQFKSKIESISGVAAQDQRLFYRGQLLEDVQTNRKLRKKFRRRISEYSIGPSETLHVLKPQWKCGALEDGLEFFYLEQGKEYFFPDVQPVFCPEVTEQSNAVTHPTPYTLTSEYKERTNQALTMMEEFEQMQLMKPEHPLPLSIPETSAGLGCKVGLLSKGAMVFADSSADATCFDCSDPDCLPFSPKLVGASYLRVPSSGLTDDTQHVQIDFPMAGVVYVASPTELGWMVDPLSYEPRPPRGFSLDPKLHVTLCHMGHEQNLHVRSKAITAPTTMNFPGRHLNLCVILFVGDSQVEFPFVTRIWTPSPSDLRRVKEYCESDERAAERAALEAQPAEGDVPGGGPMATRADQLDAMLFEIVELTALDMAGKLEDVQLEWRRKLRWITGESEQNGTVYNMEYAREMMNLLLRGADACALSDRIVALDGGDCGDGGDGLARTCLLHHCAEQSLWAAVPLLLAAGADPNLKWRVPSKLERHLRDGEEKCTWLWSAKETSSCKLQLSTQQNNDDDELREKIAHLMPAYLTYNALHQRTVAVEPPGAPPPQVVYGRRMSIDVTIHGVRTITIKDIVDTVETVAMLKSKIFQISGLPVEDQRLHYRGRELHDSRLKYNELLKKTVPTPIALREPGNPDSYDVAPNSMVHILVAGWGTCVLDDGREIFYPEHQPHRIVFEAPIERPKGVYNGDSARFPIHAAAAADDVESLVAALGPVQDYDPNHKRDCLEPIAARNEREARVAKIEDCDEDGRTPLLVAASTGSLQAVVCLLERNANIAATDPHFRWGVLHEAVEAGDWPDMIDLLLNNGAHPLARTKAGRTAAECCDPKNGRTAANGRARPKSVALLHRASIPFAREEQEKKKRDDDEYKQAQRDAMAEEAAKVRVLVANHNENNTN